MNMPNLFENTFKSLREPERLEFIAFTILLGSITTKSVE